MKVGRMWKLWEGRVDMGADVIATHKNNTHLYQCKFSLRNRPVSVGIVSDVVRGLDHYDAQKGYCVANRPLGNAQSAALEKAKGLNYELDYLGVDAIQNKFRGLAEYAPIKFSLYPYQNEALRAVVSAFESTCGRALLVMATGLGKTAVAGAFLRHAYQQDEGLRTLVLADQVEVVRQFDRSIWSFLPKWCSTHLLVNGEEPAYEEGVTLSTFQSMSRRVEEWRGKYDIVLVDEAHHAPADTYREVLLKLDAKFVLGLTATPWRSDSKDVFDLFGRPVFQLDIIEAMRRGLLANVCYQISADNIDLDWIGLVSEKGNTVRQLNKKVFVQERDVVIADEVIAEVGRRCISKYLVFCNSAEHCKRMSKLLRSNGHNVDVLLSEVGSGRDRAATLRNFRSGDIVGLCVFDIMNEGIDVPDIELIVYCRVTHSKRIFLQQMGRGLRWRPNKVLLVMDYVVDTRRLSELGYFAENVNSGDSTVNEDIEDLRLPSDFDLRFANPHIVDFMDWVSSAYGDISEFDLDDVLE